MRVGRLGLMIFHPTPNHCDRLLHSNHEGQVNGARLPPPRPPGRPPAVPALPMLAVQQAPKLLSPQTVLGLAGAGHDAISRRATGTRSVNPVEGKDTKTS